MTLPPITNASGQPITADDRHLTMKELVGMLPISKNTIYKMERNGQFPARHWLSADRVAWWQSDVELWLKIGPYSWHDHIGRHHLAKQEAARKGNNKKAA